MINCNLIIGFEKRLGSCLSNLSKLENLLLNHSESESCRVSKVIKKLSSLKYLKIDGIFSEEKSS